MPEMNRWTITILGFQFDTGSTCQMADEDDTHRETHSHTQKLTEALVLSYKYKYPIININMSYYNSVHVWQLQNLNTK